MNIQNIIRAIASRNYRITHRADAEAQNDDLDFEEIFYSVRHAILRTVFRQPCP